MIPAGATREGLARRRPRHVRPVHGRRVGSRRRQGRQEGHAPDGGIGQSLQPRRRVLLLRLRAILTCLLVRLVREAGLARPRRLSRDPAARKCHDHDHELARARLTRCGGVVESAYDARISGWFCGLLLPGQRRAGSLMQRRGESEGDLSRMDGVRSCAESTTTSDGRRAWR